MSDTVLIRISRDLAETFGTRTERGAKLSVELGKPAETVTLNARLPEAESEPVYEPTVTAIDDGMTLVSRAELARIGNLSCCSEAADAITDLMR